MRTITTRRADVRKPIRLAETKTVIYKGPFAEAVGDRDEVYPRGKRVEVSAATWDLLRRSTAAKSFLFLNADDAPSGCGS